MKLQNVTIPTRLDELLGQSALGHAVRLSLQDFGQWIDESIGGLFFFPEYTDHGPSHVSAVLTATEALIRPEAWNHLTSEDAAVLILAAQLHDCAMHLTADGFLDLIELKPNSDRILISSLDEKSWSQLFDQFYLDARRWDQRTLHNILGDHRKTIDEEEDLVTYIRHPREKPNPEDWSLRYRKFLGEFVRRHHARLAHEIALSGAPGSTLERLRLTRVPDDIANLAGLVARSHNMSLRGTFGYLKEKYYGCVNCANSHPIFLMALLRIADYLEIRSDRVSPTRMQIQRLRSPLSLEEWNAHLAVHEVRPDDEDKEAVFIIARPPTARAFLKIKNLLSGLQTELDTSWAVLGEVYSKQGELSQLGLVLRRVRSNLDDLKQFLQSEKPSYIPVRAAFDTAGVDLLKLLVKPLYGDRPEVGIRELLQNALDAVHELRQWVAERGSPVPATEQQSDQDADVVISIDREGKDYWLSIIDKGIGMTAETVRDYFLKAGASYRQSEIWRRCFEIDGVSKVLRTGRFGIGALAAFLLGSRIEVSTRHVTVPPCEGLLFNASIEDEVIELNWCHRSCVGTAIRVKLTQKTVRKLDNSKHSHDWTYAESLRRRHPWDWFTLDDPKVERRFRGEVLRQGYHLPGPDRTPLLSDWRWVPVNGYQGVFWSYCNGPDLTCNGIRIESYLIESHKKAQRKKILGSDFSIVKRPCVSVFDRDGRLPLNLQRSDIEGGELPFSAEILKDVMRDMIAFLLVHGPRNVDSAERWILSRPPFFERFTYDQAIDIERLWARRDGFSFVHPWHISKAGLSKGLLVLSRRIGEREESAVPIPASGGVFWGKSRSSRATGRLVVQALASFGLSGCRRFTLPEAERDIEAFFYSEKKRRRPSKKELVWEELGKLNQVGDALLTLELERHFDAKFFSLVELHFDPSGVNLKKSVEVDVFEDLFDVPIIPFDPEERRKKLPRAFNKLEHLVEVWQSPSPGSWRSEMVEQLSQNLADVVP